MTAPSPRVRNLGPNSYENPATPRTSQCSCFYYLVGAAMPSLTWEKASSRNLDTYLLT
jgi:hypothetical protein